MLADATITHISVNGRRVDSLEQAAALIAEKAQPQSLNGAAKEKLRQFVARVERLEEEKAEIAGQLKEVYGEAKALGYDTKALRAVIRARKQDARERDEAQMVFDLYWDVVGAA
jgi:uncharacterized protein (UPF0335 family)